MRFCLIILLVLSAIPAAGADDSDVLTPAQHYEASLEYRQAAADSVDAGDTLSAIAALESALAHQPGHGSILVNLAILSARMGDLNATQKWLNEIDRRGLAYPASALGGAFSEDVSGAITTYLKSIERNGVAAGSAETVVTVLFPDLLIESATEIDGAWYLSGIAEPGLYRLGGDEPKNLLGETTIGSVFEIVAADGLIWAATAIVPQTTDNHREAGSALLAINPLAEEIIHRFEAPAENAQITDLALDGGDIYFTDQAGGAIYKAEITAGEVTTVVAPGTFASLQGITINNGALYAADYATGIWQVDLSQGKLKHLTTDSASLIGIDGLTADGLGGLVAVRNGAKPHGALHLALSEDGKIIETVTPLATGLGDFDDPTLGFVRDGNFVFIANSQWPSFPEDGSAPETPRKPVLIMATPLPAKVR